VPSRVFPLAVSARVQYQMPRMRLVTVVTTCNLSFSTYLHGMAPPALKMPAVIHCHPVTLPKVSWVPGNASVLSEARVASAAPAASFKRELRNLAHL
jgi:hypothetical protein